RMTLGTSFRYQSGVPVNVRGSNFRYNNAVFVVPRGSGGRINGSYQWNLNFGYAYPLKNDLELEFTARVINLTNSKATLRVDDIYSFQATRPIAGGDLNDLKHARPQDGADPNDFYSRNILIRQGNYGVATSFQQPMSGQFEVKLRF
ncbi:MAG: TonB-dependent receptor, partial [Nannocystaceae bacterium]